MYSNLPFITTSSVIIPTFFLFDSAPKTSSGAKPTRSSHSQIRYTGPSSFIITVLQYRKGSLHKESHAVESTYFCRSDRLSPIATCMQNIWTLACQIFHSSVPTHLQLISDYYCRLPIANLLLYPFLANEQSRNRPCNERNQFDSCSSRPSKYYDDPKYHYSLCPNLLQKKPKKFQHYNAAIISSF